MAMMRRIGRAYSAALALSLPLLGLTAPGGGQHLFICSTGSVVERATERRMSAQLSVSISFNLNDNTSEILVGSASNSIVGQRDAIRLDGLVQEDRATITGFMLAETETSVYWTLDADEKSAIISLDDIIVRGEDCLDMGVGKPAAQAMGVSRREVDVELAGFAAARHIEALMTAQDQLLDLSG